MPQREGEWEGDNVESYLQYQLFVYTWTCMYYVLAEELELCHTEDTAPYKDKSCWRIRLSAGWHYCGMRMYCSSVTVQPRWSLEGWYVRVTYHSSHPFHWNELILYAITFCSFKCWLCYICLCFSETTVIGTTTRCRSYPGEDSPAPCLTYRVIKWDIAELL